jgi:hypothetical protein
MTGVDSSALLECLRRVIDEHHFRVASGAPAAAVPILLDDRARFARAISEVVRAEGGAYVDAMMCGNGIAVTSDPRSVTPDLVDAVEGALRELNRIEPDAGFALDLSDTEVAVRGNADYADANSANRAARELLTAMFVEALRGSALYVLAWADEHFDDQHATILWPLVCRLPQLLKSPTSSTLVLIAGEATLRATLHCAGPVSVRHTVASGGLRTRMGWETARTAIRNQRAWTAAQAPLIVMFLGAGASVVEGLATGNALRDRALAGLVDVPRVDLDNYEGSVRELFVELQSVPDRLTAKEIAAGPAEFARTLTLERLIKEEQHRENRRDSSTLRRFARDHEVAMQALRGVASAGGFDNDPLVNILRLQRRIVLVTVNFDHVVETKAPGLTKPFVTDDELALFSSYLDHYATNGGPVPLLKLHGDIGRPDTLVADTDQTGGGLARSRLDPLEALLERLRGSEIRPWWWIGYSMRDLDLEDVWGQAYFADLVVEHWVAPFVDESVRAFHARWRSDRWRRSGRYNTDERVITITASDFYALYFNEVAARW